jgi:hypothetical protein
MSVETKFYQSMIKYSEKITERCIQDSDDAVKSISMVIDFLLKDSSRISKMSSDTINAIQNLESLITEMSQKRSKELLRKLINALSGIVKEHRSVNDVIMPIVEALQFQDAIRQQMENVCKIMQIWLRARLECEKNPTPEHLQRMGETMLKATTMIRERDIIRKHVQGLPAETAADSVMLF